MSENIFDNLPVDPEQAFLVLERAFREQCETSLQSGHQDENASVYHVDYIAKVIAAITELGLEANFSTDLPLIEDVSYNTYLNFSKDVKNYCTRLEIRYGRRTQGFSVRFDAAAKSTIHNYITKIREVVQTLEVETPKKEALLKRLTALSDEIDRDRTRLEAFGELVLSVSSIAGQAAEKLEPIRRWIDSIGNLINGTRERESEVKQLPPINLPKRIEVQKSLSRSTRDLDDEVPF